MNIRVIRIASGFTLLELLITLGVLTILLSIGAMAFTNMRLQAQIDLTAAEIRTELMRTQMDAINNTESGIYFEQDRYIYFQGNTYVPGEATNQENNLPQNTSITEITFADSTAQFESIDGYLQNYSDPSHVVLSTSGEEYTISVNQWGIITVE